MPTAARPARHHINVLAQLLKYIPCSIVNAAAIEQGIEAKSRTFRVFCNMSAMIFVQLAHALSLNDVCDWLRLKARAIAGTGITPPARNTVSHANRNRDAAFVETVFWNTLQHLQRYESEFGGRRRGRRLLHRYRAKVHAVDSTTIELVANCPDWARHRRRKAAAKMHLRLDVASFMPAFAIVDAAGENDCKRAQELCAGLECGEIAALDKAYVDFEHLHDVDSGGVFWVTRAKDNFQYWPLRRLPVPKGGPIQKDQIIELAGVKWKKMLGACKLRRVEAVVEVDGNDKVMVFITNHTEWSAGSVCDLYRARWEIEVFFKQVKQTLRLSGFVGYTANAIRWQVWTALLEYVLLRLDGHLSEWGHSFTSLGSV